MIAEVARPLGWTTNNLAEYEGLIEGLKLALSEGVRRLAVFMDSALVINQMKGIYKVKHPGLKPLHEAARKLAGQFELVKFQAIPREENKHADRLSNLAMDRWQEENRDFQPPEQPTDSSSLF